jgi:DNA replication protein DnaC
LSLQYTDRERVSDDYVIDTEGEFARARPTRSIEDCDQCQGRGFLIVDEGGYEVSQDCTCRAILTRIGCYNAANIPADYADKRFTDLKEHSGSTIGKAKLWMMDYVQQANPLKEQGFVLVGKSGVGKTHLLCAVLQQLTLERGIPCKYVDCFHLTERIRGSIKDGSDLDPSDILEPLVDVPLLAIDELGKGMETPFETHVIDQLVTRRYNANRPILVTTNYIPEIMADELQDAREHDQARGDRFGPKRKKKLYTTYSLEERTDERIVSRLYEISKVLLVKGQDYRYGANA